MTGGPANGLPLLKPAPGVLTQEVEGELVLLDPGAERYYGLDPVGMRFWELLSEHEDPDRALAAMLAEFEVDERALRSDLNALLAQLDAAGLVVPADAPA